MNDERVKFAADLKKIGKLNANLKISDLLPKKKLNDNFISSPYLSLDFSKQLITEKDFNWLLSIPEKFNLRDSYSELLKGKYLNPSEHRGVSHTIYRQPSRNGEFEFVSIEKGKIDTFLTALKAKENIKNLVCIGIGGSRVGPELLVEFVNKNEPLSIFFCSSYDLLELKNTLQKCYQMETIVVVSSKSFSTYETIKNLNMIKAWFDEKPEINPEDHIYGVSSDKERMKAFGIKEDHQFEILDSLGGRYSVWSSMSIPAFVNADFQSYQDFLEGAFQADKYVLESKWEKNISMILALLGIWNASALGINNHAIFTYNYRLRSLTKYIAQLSMESNGKSINFDSTISPLETSPLIWGGYGIDSQHSTFQWMMQGKTLTSCDFIGINNEDSESRDSYEMLLSQVLAMTLGEDNKKENYKTVPGNNPCSVIQLNSLDLKTLGFLMALYEHKVFFEALILGINPFDQWGVELGKKIVKDANGKNDLFSNYFPSDFIPKS